jgi:hypothetical protein
MKMPLLWPLSALLMFAGGYLPSGRSPYLGKIKADASFAAATPSFDNGDADIAALTPQCRQRSPRPQLARAQRHARRCVQFRYSSIRRPHWNRFVDRLSRYEQTDGGQCGNTLFTSDCTLISYCAEQLDRTRDLARRCHARFKQRGNRL